jgi:hypothetical protein
MVLAAPRLLADNAREIVGTWEWVDLKAGDVRLKPEAKKKLATVKRAFDGNGGIKERGSLVNTGSYKFVTDQLLEITNKGKTEQWKIRIIGDSMVLSREDGSVKIEEKWKRAK